MPAPSSIAEFLELAEKSGILDVNRLTAYVQQLRTQNTLPAKPGTLAGWLVRDGLITLFQAEQLMLGKWKRFTIGKYKVLEKLGSGGMGQVFLCEHKMMRRRVAVKVLPTAKADDPSALERFYREARVVGALDHPNIVRAHDIDQDDNLHFLVMEYVDGPNLQEIVKRTGPLNPLRACHYVYQSALGLQHAFDAAGIVHRDIKPGNILVDRQGIVKILDMGLARFFHDEEDLLTRKFDETVLGTADYLAPEQAIDSHLVDIRADIYSLGATFYFMLTGSPPFTEGTVPQKLMWHQTKEPKPIQSIRPEVPDEVVAIVQKMMAKDPNKRYQSPKELAEAIAPLVTTPIPPPSEAEMPQLSPLARGLVGGTVTSPPSSTSAPAIKTSGPISPPPKRTSSKTDLELPPSAPTAIITGHLPMAKLDQAASEPVGIVPQPAAPPSPVAGQPRPAPAPYRAPAPMAVESIENSPLWANITSDTPKPLSASHHDTERSPVYKPPSAMLHSVHGRTQPADKSSNMKLILLIAAGVLIGAMIMGAIIAFGFVPKKKQSPKVGNEPKVLIVDAAAKPDFATTFPRVSLAAKKAQSGDVIRVRGPVQEEWTGFPVESLAKNLTIEADVPRGQYLPWRLPPQPLDTKAVLYLKDCHGWKFKGFEFDGQGKAENAIYLISHCPGLTFDNCRALNCTDSAIKLSNVAGEPDRPVAFTHFRATGTPISKSVITLFASQSIQSIKANQHVVFQDGIVDGPCKALASIDGSTEDVQFQHVRFFQGTDGIVIKPIKLNQSCELTCVSNSFARIGGSAILVQGTAADRAATELKLTLTNNLFSNCQQVITAASGQPLARLVSRDNVRDPSSAEGNAKLEARVAEVKWLSENPAEERRFLRYAHESPLNSRPFGPVGVPPAN